jgi:hypothetical protein
LLMAHGRLQHVLVLLLVRRPDLLESQIVSSRRSQGT